MFPFWTALCGGGTFFPCLSPFERLLHGFFFAVSSKGGISEDDARQCSYGICGPSMAFATREQTKFQTVSLWDLVSELQLAQ